MVLLVLFMTVIPLKAQIFIADDEFEGILRHGESEYVLVVPNQASDADQYTPVGNGMLLLVGLGGAYLLKKRKKKE